MWAACGWGLLRPGPVGSPLPLMLALLSQTGQEGQEGHQRWRRGGWREHSQQGPFFQCASTCVSSSPAGLAWQTGSSGWANAREKWSTPGQWGVRGARRGLLLWAGQAHPRNPSSPNGEEHGCDLLPSGTESWNGHLPSVASHRLLSSASALPLVLAGRGSLPQTPGLSLSRGKEHA